MAFCMSSTSFLVSFSSLSKELVRCPTSASSCRNMALTSKRENGFALNAPVQVQYKHIESEVEDMQKRKKIHGLQIKRRPASLLQVQGTSFQSVGSKMGHLICGKQHQHEDNVNTGQVPEHEAIRISSFRSSSFLQGSSTKHNSTSSSPAVSLLHLSWCLSAHRIRSKLVVEVP